MSYKFCLPALAATTVLLTASAGFAGGYVAPAVDAAVLSPVAPAPQVDWAGGYAGGFVGGVFGGDDVVGISSDDDVDGSPGSLDLSGVKYGIQAGYRWQRDWNGRSIVYGPEIAYEGGSASDSFDNDGVSAETSIDNMLALRFKTGVLNAAQDTLFYGSLGFGRGEFDYKVVGGGMDYDDSYKSDAWLVGLGVERKLNERLSIFGEWEYAGFDKETLTDANGFTTRATPAYQSLKVGVNFSF